MFLPVLARREQHPDVSTTVPVTGTCDDVKIGAELAGLIGTVIAWHAPVVYVPFEWLTGNRFPPGEHGVCVDAMDRELPPEWQELFLQRDVSPRPKSSR